MRGKNEVNVSQCFLVFMSLVGDTEKTAAALDLDPDFVRKLAKDEGWTEKIQRICLLGKSGKPGDFERAQNRALAFVQAHQTREILSRVVARFQDMSDEEILEATASVAKDGSRHVWADLTSAMEKAHSMAYAALGDSCGERKDRSNEASDEINSAALHIAVINALNNPKVNSIDVVAEVVKATETQVKQLSSPPAESVPTEPASSVPTTECAKMAQ
jgi:hypothetical protein